MFRNDRNGPARWSKWNTASSKCQSNNDSCGRLAVIEVWYITRILEMSTGPIERYFMRVLCRDHSSRVVVLTLVLWFYSHRRGNLGNYFKISAYCFDIVNLIPVAEMHPDAYFITLQPHALRNTLRISVHAKRRLFSRHKYFSIHGHFFEVSKTYNCDH